MALLIEYWNDGSAQRAETTWDRRSVYLNSLVLLARPCVLGLIHQL